MLPPRLTHSELGEFIGLCLASASHVVANAGQIRPPILIEREVSFLSGAKINSRGISVRDAPNPEVAASQSMLIAQAEYSKRFPKARCLAAVLFVAHRELGEGAWRPAILVRAGSAKLGKEYLAVLNFSQSCSGQLQGFEPLTLEIPKELGRGFEAGEHDALMQSIRKGKDGAPVNLREAAAW
ncbi:hypothetical protein CCR94_12460 [Rhodoblastus sphagnicola]|uniref:Uncharacterized protein n=1 Tax=Rhodoblastus sphagnicola TaxID=333368 RepID=A0A2S6N774_9HYPH|nr:hypothetical protein [Rhodoblastus sphagnicola]MBB4197417.1 hypothetical protein [Rhodoblastus sphagnicola]PPQ30447.1 hypothetical protein CCR94_12460 [Rhodoblastus sphagnicola]